MSVERKFSFFKNKTTTFDWVFILVIGLITTISVFVYAFYLLNISQSVDSSAATSDQPQIVTINRERFDKINERFEKREENLVEILNIDPETTLTEEETLLDGVVEENVEDVEGEVEGSAAQEGSVVEETS